ncbi:MAG: hypothetical protein ACREBA_08195, partial [Nitrosotalea sp.]
TINTALVIAPNPPQSLNLSYLGNSTTPVITAAVLDGLNFAVANNSTDPMSNILISLVPQSTSVSVVGPSTWNIQNLTSGARQVLSTQVYAANTLIGTPASFTLTATYLSKGQSQTNSLTLGTFVVGDIRLQIYGLTLTTSGSTSSLVGNLLNQGSTTALFTTAQLAPSQLTSAMKAARMNSTNGTGFNGGGQGGSGQGFQGNTGGSGQGFQGNTGGSGQGFTGGTGGQGRGGQGGAGGFGQGRGGGGSSATQQFIGDLSPDSPIPISIPIRGINSLSPGMYQVAFKVVYADDLKNFHTVIVNGSVNVARTPQVNTSADQNTSILNTIPLPALIGAPIAVVAVIVFLVKRKRSAKKKLKLLTQGDTDIVSIFDSTKKKENES